MIITKYYANDYKTLREISHEEYLEQCFTEHKNPIAIDTCSICGKEVNIYKGECECENHNEEIEIVEEKKVLKPMIAGMMIEEKMKELGMSRKTLSMECVWYPNVTHAFTEGIQIKCNMVTHKVSVLNYKGKVHLCCNQLKGCWEIRSANEVVLFSGELQDMEKQLEVMSHE